MEGVKSMEHPPLKAVVFHNDKGKVLVETVLGVNSKVVVFLGVNNLLVEGFPQFISSDSTCTNILDKHIFTLSGLAPLGFMTRYDINPDSGSACYCI